MNTRSKQCLSFKDIINKDNNDDKKIQSQETRSKKRKYTNIDINLSLNKQNNNRPLLFLVDEKNDRYIFYAHQTYY